MTDMSPSQQELHRCVGCVAALEFAWAGSLRTLQEMARRHLDADDREIMGWAKDLGRFETILRHVGLSGGKAQFYSGGVLVVSSDTTDRPSVDPWPRAAENRTGCNCAYCGLSIDAVRDADMPTQQASDGRRVHQICSDLYDRLPVEKRWHQAA